MLYFTLYADKAIDTEFNLSLDWKIIRENNPIVLKDGYLMNFGEYNKILKFAIQNEAKAFGFYKSVAEKVKDESVKELFLDMADEEKKHREILEEYIGTEPKPLEFKNDIIDYKISEQVEKPEPSIDMKYVEAIALAMKGEEEAVEMYSNLAEICTDTAQKKMFESLAAMEREDKIKLEEIYNNAAYGELW